MTATTAAIRELDATTRDLVTGFATGSMSPVDVVRETLDRIEQTNPMLNAFLAVDRSGASAAARDAEARWTAWRDEHGPLMSAASWQQLPTWGIPVSVKDTVEQAGLPTTYGSAVFADNRQPDAAVVGRLRRAGCILVGKSNTSEFALSTVTANRLGPPTRNPWDMTRTSGGSSGGASAGAAAGIGGFALGTDSAGSIRLPAAYCGLYGLKPTFGTVPVRQRWRASPVRSHLGPLARTVDDLVYAWRVLTGDDEIVEPLAADENVRVALVRGDPDHGGVLDEFMGLLGATGRCGITADHPVQLPPMPSMTTTEGEWVFAGDHLAAAERLAPDFLAGHADELTDYARPIYESGRRIPAWEYRMALDACERYRDAGQGAFDAADALVTSATGAPPMLAGDEEHDDLGPRYPLLSVWNLTGNPALVVPLAPGADGLPRSVQLVARHGADRLLIRLAMTLVRCGLLVATGQVAPPIPTSEES